MKKSDLTAYLDGELQPDGIADVESTMLERQELLDELTELCLVRFLVAEHLHNQIAASPDAAPVGKQANKAEAEAEDENNTKDDQGGFPTEPPPVDVERPRRARSGPAPFAIAAAASITALVLLNSLEIGGWTRSSRAVAETGYVMRYGQTAAIEQPRVLYFDDYLTTQDEAAPVIYSDTSTSITLGPWSKARFFADLNSKCIEIIEGSINVKVEPPPPKKKPPPPAPKKSKKKPAPKPTPPPPPTGTDWKQLAIDTIEPWLTPRKVTNPQQILISSTAGNIEVPQKHTDTIEFTFKMIDRTFELDHRRGATDFTSTSGDSRRIGGRQHLRSEGDGKVHRIGKTKSKARITLTDAQTTAPLATCEAIQPNHHVGLSFRNARPITAEFKMGRPVTSVHFFLSYRPPDGDKFTDLNADSFRPKGKVTSNKAPFLFFGELGGNSKNPPSWQPHKAGTYRLRAIPVLPKQSKPNHRDAVVVYLDYK